MSTDALDQALAVAVKEALALGEPEQLALWEGVAARVRGEAQTWAFFMVAMVRSNARVRPAAIRSSWANRSYSARQ